MRVDGGLRWLWGWRGLVQREGQAHSPTKSGRDSAVLEGWCGNPSGSCPNYFGRQHLTFDKGGKDVGVRRMMVRMRKRISTHRRSPYEKWA